MHAQGGKDLAQLLCEWPEVYVVEVPYPAPSTRATNAFFVHSGSEWLLVDTGCDTQRGAEMLDEALDVLRIDRSHLKVFITHSHVDHAGLLYRFADCPIVIGEPTYRMNSIVSGDGYARYIEREFAAEGFPAPIPAIGRHVVGRAYTHLDFPIGDLRIIGDGETFSLGSLSFRAIHTPGHTTGHMMLLEEQNGLLFAGDAVLPRIVPSIDLMPEGRNGFTENLQTMRRLQKMTIRMAFYGHAHYAGFGSEQAFRLAEHHEKRKGEYLELIAKHPGNCAFGLMKLRRSIESLESPRWQKLIDSQKASMAAMSIGALRMLVEEGAIARFRGSDDTWRYHLCDG